ncbi:MAG: pilus assembly protein [Anaerolineales bacterium]|nr:pilus assembly protein [Anaerolineales bacterium]
MPTQTSLPLPPSFRPPRKKSRGQSLVEFALFLPILVMLLGGLVELGLGLNRFINIIEAAREGARYGSDLQPDPRLDGRDLVNIGGQDVSNMDCESTRDFYGKIACVVQQAADPAVLNDQTDDIVITVARIYRSPLCDEPSPPPGLDCTARILPDPDGLWPDPPLDPAEGEIATRGRWRWSGAGDSKFTREEIQNYIDANALSSGVLIVEVFYRYHMILNLPWITPFLDPAGIGLPFYTYTIIPVPAGEPRPTPTPTFTPSPTPSPTLTSTYTPTPGPTATFTPTPTDTPTPTPTDTPPPTNTPTTCRSGYVSVQKSSFTFVTGRQWPDYAWADDAQSLRVQVMLVSECDEPLLSRTITIRTNPERASTDTITFDQSAANLYWYFVRSRTVGITNYTAATELCPASDPMCAGRVDTTVVAIPLTPIVGHYVCVYGQRDISLSSNTLVLAYNNPAPSASLAWPPRIDRRLIRLSVEWPAGSLRLQTISFGSTSNVIWSGSAGTSPSTFGDGTGLPWTSPNRAMVFSPVKTLQLVFDQPITPASGSYTYRITAVWDDTLGGSVCTSDVVSVTLP